MTTERSVVCSRCHEMRRFDPRKQGDPGCPCRSEASKRSNRLAVTRCFEEPILMYSVALHPSEEKSFRLANREIDLTPDGVPIARTRQEKKQVLKHFGFQENN